MSNPQQLPVQSQEDWDEWQREANRIRAELDANAKTIEDVRASWRRWRRRQRLASAVEFFATFALGTVAVVVFTLVLPWAGVTAALLLAASYGWIISGVFYGDEK